MRTSVEGLNRCGSAQTKSMADQTALTQEKREAPAFQDSLFSQSRYDGNFDLARLNKINAFGRFALREDFLIFVEVQ